MSSASKLIEVAVTELPYVSAKEKAVRKIKLTNNLISELLRPDVRAKDVIRWELQLFNIMYAESMHGRGCLGNVNLNKVRIDENKQLSFCPSDKEFISKDFNHELKLVKTMITTHDEIYDIINERQRSIGINTEIQFLKIISDYFYAVATNLDCESIADEFLIKCEHLAQMIDGGMINVLMSVEKF